MSSFKDFFNFNKRQERGIIVLSLLLLIVILLNYYAPQLAPDPPIHHIENIKYLKQVKLQKYLEVQNYEASDKKNKYKPYKEEDIQVKINDFFNPNTVSIEKLVSFGIPKRIAININNYRKSGGAFYNKEDLKKIYTISDELFVQLEPFIHIPPKPKVRKITMNTSTQNADIVNSNSPIQPINDSFRKELQLGINSADSLQLLEVYGIGKFYAKEIVEYRIKLGGYNDINQLKELFKMSDEKLEKMKIQLFLDTIPLRKININEVSFKALLKHPYVDYETTKYMMNKRNKLGKYAALYQIQDPVHMPDSLFSKLKPYLMID